MIVHQQFTLLKGNPTKLKIYTENTLGYIHLFISYVFTVHYWGLSSVLGTNLFKV